MADTAQTAAWAAAEQTQEAQFKALSLHDKWQAVTDASGLMELIERAAAPKNRSRCLQRQTHESFSAIPHRLHSR